MEMEKPTRKYTSPTAPLADTLHKNIVVRLEVYISSGTAMIVGGVEREQNINFQKCITMHTHNASDRTPLVTGRGSGNIRHG